MAVIVSSTEYWLDYGTGGMASNDNDMFYVVNNIEGHRCCRVQRGQVGWAR